MKRRTLVGMMLMAALSGCAVDTESEAGFDDDQQSEAEAVAARHYPVCRYESTRSEGWYWADTGARIRGAECSGQIVACTNIATRSEGWYVGADRVWFDRCSTTETQRLKTLSAGLQYPSESDVAFDVLQVPGAPSGTMSQTRLRAIFNIPASTPIDTTTVDEALSPRRFEEHPDAARFETLRQSLRGYRVFRVGTIQVHIYFVKVLGGQLVGLHTVSIET